MVVVHIDCGGDCIEADGGAQNFRIIENRCLNMTHRALSAQPALGGPIYFIRNVVYHAPESGALKLTANAAGVLVYNNTFLAEVHQMGPASNLHFRNNLMLAQGAWPEVFSMETFTPWSTSDYNGLSASAATGSSLFAWAAPADAAVTYDSRAARPVQSFADLKTYSNRTGQVRHSRMIDWSIFRKAGPPAKGDPTRLYRPDDFDSRWRPDPGPSMRGGSARRHRWLYRQGTGLGRARIGAGRSSVRSAAAFGSTDDAEKIRLMSARRASRRERATYDATD